MPNYTASHRTKSIFLIFTAAISSYLTTAITALYFLCQCRPWLGLPCRILYSVSLFVVPCLGSLRLDLDHVRCRPLYGRVVCRVLYQRGVLWFYCSTVPICGCSSSDFYQCLPLLQLFAGWFRWHFERHWQFFWPGSPMSIIVCVYCRICFFVMLVRTCPSGVPHF